MSSVDKKKKKTFRDRPTGIVHVANVEHDLMIRANQWRRHSWDKAQNYNCMVKVRGIKKKEKKSKLGPTFDKFTVRGKSETRKTGFDFFPLSAGEEAQKTYNR